MGDADWTEPPKAWLDTAADTAEQLLPSQSTAQLALLVLGVSQLVQAALAAFCVRCGFTGEISCNLGFNLFGKPLGAALRFMCREDTADAD